MKKKELLKRIEALEVSLHNLVGKSPLEEVKKELEIGKWYKNTKSDGTLINLQTCNDNEKSGYGIHLGIWGTWGMLNHEDYILATPQEVGEVLIKEAKWRYKVGDKLSKVCNDGADDNRFFDLNSFVFENNHLYLESIQGLCYSYCIFKNGKWAEVLKQEQKPKVGDVVKAWDNNESNFVIGVISDIDDSLYPYDVGNTFYKNVELITDPNIISYFKSGSL